MKPRVSLRRDRRSVSTKRVGRTRLAWAVAAARQRRCLTLREAAKQAGVHWSLLFRVETGSIPDVKNFLAIARWLDMVPTAALESLLKEDMPS